MIVSDIIPSEVGDAFGGPGIPPRWTASTKTGVGTAYHTAARVWFTVSHGIANELYYPTIDRPNTRDFQVLVTDGETFFHEERSDLDHVTERPNPLSLRYRLVNSDPAGRYRIVKDVIVDPHQAVFLMRVRLEIEDASLRGKLKAYVLLAPHVEGKGECNNADWSDSAGRMLLHAWRNQTHLVLGAKPDFTKRSVGYVGSSDGYTDLRDNLRMDWQFDRAEDGNLALVAELDLCEDHTAIVGVGFGNNETSAACSLLQTLSENFDDLVAHYDEQWSRVLSDCDDPDNMCEMAQLSHCLLLAHEDKTFQGALIASLSIPWGETQDDSDSGGYHLVWPRDMMQTAVALLSVGHFGTPRRALAYLACIQGDDGTMPQNCWLDGTAYWPGQQLDEAAAPLLLAWQLRTRSACGDFDTTPVFQRGARKLVLNGPVTSQERWEENSGYSPATIAACIAALTGAADALDDLNASDFLQDYADWLNAHVEEWCVTTTGTLVAGISRHYLRITPAQPGTAPPPGQADTATIEIKNGGGSHLAKQIVGGDFLALVRYGIRPADDPVVVDSVKVIDDQLKFDLPGGPAWRRYNFDGYGNHADGSAYNGSGLGGCWPLLSGERGLYELAAGRDAQPYLRAMEAFANDGGMIPEQVWYRDDIPEKDMFRGAPSGSAMPLCWAHAEYLNLTRSAKDGRCFDRVGPAYERYVIGNKRGSYAEYWTQNYPVSQTPANQPLRIVLPACASIRWSGDGWLSQSDTATSSPLTGLHYAEIPVGEEASIEFTIHWGDDQWENENHHVEII